MTTLSKTLSFSILFLLLSAGLHFLGAILGGFAPAALFLIGPGVLYLVIAHFLRRSIRWLAWLTFFIMLIGGIGSLASVGTASPVPDWIYYSIFIVDYVCAAGLLVFLWRSKA